jgi:hypothetical protein
MGKLARCLFVCERGVVDLFAIPPGISNEITEHQIVCYPPAKRMRSRHLIALKQLTLVLTVHPAMLDSSGHDEACGGLETGEVHVQGSGHVENFYTRSCIGESVIMQPQTPA